jgi:ATP-dependent Lhr-like helicase
VSKAFDRLDPALQYQVAYGLGFSDLRPVQELSIDAVLDGANVVILAPTAGGKTEAAFFPLLSEAIQENWHAPSILYLTPIKALINNQEERLTHLTGLVGRRAFKWHGDVSTSMRKAFLREPADVLLTTPESLEAMLISKKVSSEAVFRNLQAVVIDEVHAFAGDDRGGHLASVLERIQRFAKRDLQRIGLSATVGNPPKILEWMQGSSTRPQRLVDPPKAKASPKVELDFVGNLANAAVVIERLHPGKKRLVFADSRQKVEALGRALDERGVRAFVMHSSLSMAERTLAEREFADGKNCVVVATSAMELGIDIGDLDHVLQIDSPRTVASFLQRMGRTGRRPGTTPNCTFLCTEPKHLIQAAALIELQREGYVEPVEPSTGSPHLVAHQILAICLQEGRILRSDLFAWIQGSRVLQRIDPVDLQDILNHMLRESLLVEDEGHLVFGPEAERLYGFANFLEMYAVFETTRDYLIVNGRNEIGALSPLWVAQKGHIGTEFTLGGKPWEIRAVDHKSRRIDVARGKRGGAIGWVSNPLALSFRLCQKMQELLRGDDRREGWTDRAFANLALQREDHANIPSDGITMHAWHTYAGAGANTVFAWILEQFTGTPARFDNFSVELPAAGGAPDHQPIRLVARIRERARNLSASDRTSIANKLEPELLGKFRACLPPRLVQSTLSTKLLDYQSAMTL